MEVDVLSTAFFEHLCGKGNAIGLSSVDLDRRWAFVLTESDFIPDAIDVASESFAIDKFGDSESATATLSK